MAVDTSWRANSDLVGYGGLGSATPPTLTSFSSSLPPPPGIPSSDPTVPNLGLRFKYNSGSVPFCSTKPLLPSSSVPPIPLHLFQTLILLICSCTVMTSTILWRIHCKMGFSIEKEELRLRDLSNNNLVGDVPSFLSQLQFLRVLDLEGNQLSGTIPTELTERSKNGSLKLRLWEKEHLE